MIRSDWSRLRRVAPTEIAWRVRQAADIVVGRTITAARPPAWRRQALSSRLVKTGELATVAAALKSQRWRDAHVGLARHVMMQPARFVISPAMRRNLAAAVQEQFPAASEDARARGDRLLAGRYELLGYSDLQFDGRSWHRDIVHDRTAPLSFWSRVP